MMAFWRPVFTGGAVREDDIAMVLQPYVSISHHLNNCFKMNVDNVYVMSPDFWTSFLHCRLENICMYFNKCRMMHTDLASPLTKMTNINKFNLYF